MEDVIIIESAGQQNRDIPNRNKHLKTIALNILKYLPEDILREEPDFSAIKSSGVTIQTMAYVLIAKNQFCQTTLPDLL